MKKSLILLPLLLILAIVIFFILISQAITKEIENTIIDKNSFVEERVDDIWTIEEGMMGSSELLISINGKIIHGDRMRYRLMDDCETINVLTQFSTMKKNPKTERISQLYISAKYIDEDIQVIVPFVNKMPWKEIADVDLEMWVFWVDLGWYKIDNIKEYHKNIDEITLSIKHNALFKADNYLDNKSNSWSTNGMNEAIDRAVNICKLRTLENNEAILQS
jgi:hypothetical protein